MKLKTKKIILSIIGIICYGILVLLFLALDVKTTNARRENFTQHTYQFLSENAEFVEKYGTIVLLDPIDKELISGKEDDIHKYPYNYMRFSCYTEKAELIIYVETTYLDSSSVGKWAGFSYVVENETWK